MLDLACLLKQKKYFILDLDGTLYQGGNLFPYTIDFLERLRKSGRKPIFLTNNSSRSTDEYLQKFNKMGIKCRREEIYSSTQATIEYLPSKGLRRIFLMAVPTVEKEFEEAGFELFHGGLGAQTPLSEERLVKNQKAFNKPKSGPKSVPGHTLQSLPMDKSAHTLPQAVVLTFDQTFTYQKFCIAHDLIMAGVPFYATHPDKLLPIENGKFHPDIGALIEAFKTSTNRSPTIIGKPEKIIYQLLASHLAKINQHQSKSGARPGAGHPGKGAHLAAGAPFATDAHFVKGMHLAKRGAGIGAVPKSQMVMIGDRLYTDIKGANDFGIDSILVLSGETTAHMAKKSPIKATVTIKNVSRILDHLSFN